MKTALVIALLALCQCHFGKPDERVVPPKPVWADVKPIFDDHCNLCHGQPSNRGAPTYFHLDVYADGGDYVGASTMATTALEKIASNSMPPAAAWGDGLPPNDRRIIELWVGQGALEFP